MVPPVPSRPNGVDERGAEVGPVEPDVVPDEQLDGGFTGEQAGGPSAEHRRELFGGERFGVQAGSRCPPVPSIKGNSGQST